MYAFVPKNLKKIVIRTVVFTSRQVITGAVNSRPRRKNIAKVPHFQTAITSQFRRATLSFKVRIERINFH